ncbi:hypothetical protein VTO42DRAFT_618 [Malbranchea cinnamomea]
MAVTKTHDPEPHAIKVETTAEGITTIGINRIHKKNAINPPTAEKLYNAFLSFEDDATQKVCVLYGIGGTFCSGFDLSELANWDSTPANSSGSGDGNTGIARKYFAPVQGRNQGPLGPSRMLIKKPVICAISGYAVAGGLELSVLADLRVMEEDAVCGIFSRRFGVPLLDGGTVRLQAIIGLGRALDLILTGRTVSAQEALSLGLANRVVPKGKAFEEAMKLAKALASFPQECLNVDRMSVYYTTFQAKSIEDALANEYENAMQVADLAIEKALRFAQGGNKGRRANL